MYQFTADFKDRATLISIVLIISLVIIQNVINIALIYRKDLILQKLTAIEEHNQFVKQKYTDHVKWANALAESIAAGTEFRGELNHNETPFAKWYYSFSGSAEYWNMDNELRAVFDEIGPVNVDLHNTARQIYGVSSRNEVLKLYTENTKKHLEKMESLFNRFIELNNRVAERQKEIITRYSRITMIAGVSLHPNGNFNRFI